MSSIVTLKYVLKYVLFVFKMGIILFTVIHKIFSFICVQVQFFFILTWTLIRLNDITEDQNLIL